LREPLSSVILNVKRLKQQGDLIKILSLAMQPPKIGDIQRTIILLKEVGALTNIFGKNSDGTNKAINHNDGELTYVGNIMANLPIDPRLSKLILLGHALGKLKDTLVIAAGHSLKTMFVHSLHSDIEFFKGKWAWSDGWMCDSICILNVFDLWEQMNEKGRLTRNDGLVWAKNNMIQLDRLNEVSY
jgi:ATP-dependent RNA helicase TDRD9